MVFFRGKKNCASFPFFSLSKCAGVLFFQKKQKVQQQFSRYGGFSPQKNPSIQKNQHQQQHGQLLPVRYIGFLRPGAEEVASKKWSQPRGWGENSFPLLKTEADLGGSENSGTPKSSILIGFSIINHPFWGTSIFGNTHFGESGGGKGMSLKTKPKTQSCLVFFGRIVGEGWFWTLVGAQIG